MATWTPAAPIECAYSRNVRALWNFAPEFGFQASPYECWPMPIALIFCESAISGNSQRFEFFVPRRTIWPTQPSVRFGIADDFLFSGVPFQFTVEAKRNVREMACGRNRVARCEIRIRCFAAAHAIQEVLRVIDVLGLITGRFNILRLGPKLALWFIDRLRAAHRMAADDFREGVDRIHHLIGNNVEAIAPERHRSFRAHERERAHAR